MNEKPDGRPRHWILQLLLDFASIATGIAAIVAIFLGISQQRQSERQMDFTLAQAAEDRQRFEADQLDRVLPFLAFETTNTAIAIEEDKREQYRFDFIRDEAGRMLEADSLPVLRNYGAGRAFDVRVEYVADGLPKRDLQMALLTVPRHIFPEVESRVHGFPDALNDPASDSREARGKAVITCTDIRGKKLSFRQSFRAFITRRVDGKLELMLMFEEIEFPFDWGSAGLI